MIDQPEGHFARKPLESLTLPELRNLKDASTGKHVFREPKIRKRFLKGSRLEARVLTATGRTKVVHFNPFNGIENPNSFTGKEFREIRRGSGAGYRNQRRSVTVHAQEALGTGIMWRYGGQCVPRVLGVSQSDFRLFLEFVGGNDSKQLHLLSKSIDTTRKLWFTDLSRISTFSARSKGVEKHISHERVNPLYSREIREENWLDDLRRIYDAKFREEGIEEVLYEPFNETKIDELVQERFNVSLKDEVKEIVTDEILLEMSGDLERLQLQHGDMRPVHIKGNRFIDLESFAYHPFGKDVVCYITDEGNIGMPENFDDLPKGLAFFLGAYEKTKRQLKRERKRSGRVFRKYSEKSIKQLSNVHNASDINRFASSIISQTTGRTLHIHASNERKVMTGNTRTLLSYAEGIPDWGLDEIRSYRPRYITELFDFVTRDWGSIFNSRYNSASTPLKSYMRRVGTLLVKTEIADISEQTLQKVA